MILPVAKGFTTNSIKKGLAQPITSRNAPLWANFGDVFSINKNEGILDFTLFEGKNFDAILTYPTEESFQENTRAGTDLGKSAFLFSGRSYCRYSIKDKEIKKGDSGKPRLITARNGFQTYPYTRVDACLLFPPGHEKRNSAYIFCENQYLEYDLTKGSNKKGTRTNDGNNQDGKVGGGDLSNLLGEKIFNQVENLGAICVFPPGEGPDGDKNEYRAYFFFSDKKYVVWNLKDQKKEKVVVGPKPINKGFADYPLDTVDAVLQVASGSYFFDNKGNYCKYSNHEFYKPELSDVRFNKYPPVDEKNKAYKNLYATGTYGDVFPAKFPLSDETAKILKTDTMADSVVIAFDDNQLTDEDSKTNDKKLTQSKWKKDTITGAKADPIYPGDSGFWEQMKEVIEAQTKRVEGNTAQSLYQWPGLWKGKPALSPWPGNEPNSNDLTLEDVAQSVKGEFSNYHQLILLRDFSGVKLSTDIGLPKNKDKKFIRSNKDFIGMQLRMAAMNAWSLEMVGPVNFMLKWRYGMPRPEEVAWLIETGKIDAPDHVKKAMGAMKKAMTEKGLSYDNATDFTAYAGSGSPTHPSFPAMHSAGSTCSLWTPVLYDISADQYLEALRTDYGVSFARTVAGVHYPQDNIAGLNIGQRIIREKLPTFLGDNYKYDKDLVQQKVENLSFDWSKVKFTDKGCTITKDGITFDHTQFLQKATGRNDL